MRINRFYQIISLNSVFELFACTEFYHIGGLNFDRCPGLRIAALTGFTAYFRKSSEAHQRHLAVFFLNALVTLFMKEFRAAAAATFEMPASLAAFSTNSAFVIIPFPLFDLD